PLQGFLPIHMPANTAAGIVIAGLATVFGFAMIWQMWPLAILGFVAVITAAIVHTFNYKRDFYIPVDQVVVTEEDRTRMLARHV
ncbi:MAG: cytochrome o ubiquinol oxidase subunit I, partial [Alphaproteobacteria bacterium]